MTGVSPGPLLPRHTLSKSDFKLARTCPTKLYYREMRYPDTSQEDEYLLWLAEGGFMVEAIARLSFPEGTALEFGRDQAAALLATTEQLKRDNVTLFEATIIAGARLVRVDILRKAGRVLELFEVKAKGFEEAEADKRLEKTGSMFRSLRRKDGRYPLMPEMQAKYLEDIAYQVDVVREAFPHAEIRPFLILVNKDHRTGIDGLPRWFNVERRELPGGGARIHRVQFTGDAETIRKEPFVKTIDVAGEVSELLPEIQAASRKLLASLGSEPSRIPPVLRKVCGGCEFRVGQGQRSGFLECWGDRGVVTPHALDLYFPPPQLDDWITAGVNSLFDIPTEQLVRKDGTAGVRNERQLIQIAHSRDGKEWIGGRLAQALRSVQYPLHFIDFEAARTAVPHHAGMRPYGQVAFQWSCHTQVEPGGLFEHREWINLDDLWPNHDFAVTLRDAIGSEGTVLTWSHFERTVLSEVARELDVMGKGDADLGAWLGKLSAKEPEPTRILDLYQLCLKAYFHPGMGGKASVKVVLDSLWSTEAEVRRQFAELVGREGDPGQGPYASLPPACINGTDRFVQEGTGAIRAYEAMIYGVERDDVIAKAAWRQLLLDYCRLDTLAMVLIWEHWRRLTTA